MDQKYLNALLEIPPLKAVDAAGLKAFANILHGAVVTLAKSRFSEDLNSRTTMMLLEVTRFSEGQMKPGEETGGWGQLEYPRFRRLDFNQSVNERREQEYFCPTIHVYAERLQVS
jgi:hypothetical protein